MIRRGQGLCGFHCGDVVVHDHAEIHGTVQGTITVAAGRHLHFRGALLGNLIIEKDAFVLLHGRIPGLVLNDGGTVTVVGSAHLITDAAGCRALLQQKPADDIPHRTLLAYLAGRETAPKAAVKRPRKALAGGWKLKNADPPPPAAPVKKASAGWKNWIDDASGPGAPRRPHKKD